MEWHSETPDGREVVIRRRGKYWLVRCGRSLVGDQNLDVALARAIRADTEVDGEAPEVGYASWVRDTADRLARAV